MACNDSKMKYEETPFHIKNSLKKENRDNCNWKTIKNQKKSLEKGRKMENYINISKLNVTDATHIVLASILI